MRSCVWKITISCNLVVANLAESFLALFPFSRFWLFATHVVHARDGMTNRRQRRTLTSHMRLLRVPEERIKAHGLPIAIFTNERYTNI